MLTLIGLGLSDESDMTLRGVDAARSAEKVYMEMYTGKWSGSVERLHSMLGKDHISLLKRRDLEEDAGKIINEAKTRKVAILVQGDPLVATTHSSVFVEAKKRGVETRVVHSSSIFSAIAETGLHIYKFGSTVTLPFMEKTGGKLPRSVYDSIKENKSRGLHTLCLLDVGDYDGAPMNPRQAVDLLLAMERQFGEGVIGPAQKVVVLCSAGSGSKILYDEIEAVQAGSGNDTPSVIVVPGKLHFAEEDFLQSFKE